MFDNLDVLIEFMADNGAERILFKCLAENDNSKQQIYLGGSFEALNQLPFGEVFADNLNGSQPNYKAALNFYWINDEGNIQSAPRAQLILYPKYPEVRLSGFLQRCTIAPREHLQPVPAKERRYNNEKDGRVLVLGICPDGCILAYLAPAGTSLANELTSMADDSSIFTSINIVSGPATKSKLLSEIQSIQHAGWISGCRMNARGEIIGYNAPNGGGYTLEACLGIIPNAKSEPDWNGWEVKAFAGNTITLMTPEPDSGYYGQYGVGEFVRRYGRPRPAGDFYFTGVHKCGDVHTKTEMCMILDGYDAKTNRISDVTGGLTLLDPDGCPAAIWTFAKLIEHWGKKHACAVYIPYSKREFQGIIEYQYENPVMLGEGTDFYKFLQAFYNGTIVYDPASKLFINKKGNWNTKARNQFRIHKNDLKKLYDGFLIVDLQ